MIRTIKAYVRCTLAKDVAVTAPTGVAAHNIGGMTIHRLLQLPVEHGKTPVYKSLSDDVLKIIRDNMKSVILLIIDEISMVSNIMLLYIHFRLTEVYNTSDEGDGWFGKIHLIVLGDLLQLSPVMEGPPFEQISQGTIDKCVACIGSIDFWKELFTYDELTINVRQNKDQEFASILSRARIGALNDEDVNILNTRLICFQTESIESRRAELAKYVLDQDINSLVILPTRIHCAQLNLACLELVNSEVCYINSRRLY
uniref:ATP-dependent DNA helicase n=1 Tax=Cacopsylla melanoneura TaxID=428564 RepID=A0A8D8Z998_9HEMI